MSEVASRTEILRQILAAVEAGMPEPQDIHMMIHAAGGHSLSLRMEDNQPEQVAEWAAYVSDPAATVRVGSPFVDRTPWRAHKAGGIGEGVVWHGWTFEVWSAVDEPTEASS